MAKYEVDNALEELDGSRITTLLTRLNEQVYLISNALGLPDKVEDGAGKAKKKGTLNLKTVGQTGNKPIAVAKQQRGKLLPTNLIYKEEDAPVESLEEPEDSQDKEMEQALEKVLELYNKLKNTVSVDQKDVQTPIDEQF
tara:strand:+ start:150 stop:569 length:420 start_codon:yes stop_codon:yes gene_type:complete